MWENNDIEKVLITSNEITNRVKKLGAEITKDYEGHPPLLVALLRGSVPFLAELIKYIDLDIQYDFMDVTSYEGTESIGDVKVNKDLTTSIKGLDILLVEDIVDTGLTIKTIKDLLLHKGARSVKIATLLNKKERRTTEIDPEYIGFEIPNEFIVGFGMDYDQKYRQLPYIGTLKKEVYEK